MYLGRLKRSFRKPPVRSYYATTAGKLKRLRYQATEAGKSLRQQYQTIPRPPKVHWKGIAQAPASYLLRHIPLVPYKLDWWNRAGFLLGGVLGTILPATAIWLAPAVEPGTAHEGIANALFAFVMGIGIAFLLIGTTGKRLFYRTIMDSLVWVITR